MSDPLIRTDAATDRRVRILSRLRADGFLAVNDLAHELQVSHMTIRRDLHVLEDAGQVRMVHGGVSLTPESLRTAAFPDDGNAEARLRIAQYAAGMVGPSDTVVIDAGPTALAVARALPAEFSGSVITHSMPVLQLLDEQPGAARAVALGGELLAGRHAFAGPSTEAALEQLRARVFFVSPAAVDSRGGYARSSAEASLQRHLIGIAERVVLVATHQVFDSSAPARIATLDRLADLVTDRRPPPPVAAALRRAGVTTHILDS
jgi:DeoR/GlpR family transcriptional regulator of sugar metabolism